MPTSVPTEAYYSLNQAADCAGMERQAFRKLIGEFEQKAGKLPTRINEHDKESKYIPADFLHIFEEAALWMKTDECSEAAAMSYTLHLHRSGALKQLALSVEDRRPLIGLPTDLRKAAQELRAAAVIPRVSYAKIADEPAIAEGLDRLYSGVIWSRRKLILVGLAAFVLGGGLSAKIVSRSLGGRVDALQAKVNQQQYTLTKQLDRIEKRLGPRR